MDAAWALWYAPFMVIAGGIIWQTEFEDVDVHHITILHASYNWTGINEAIIWHAGCSARGGPLMASWPNRPRPVGPLSSQLTSFKGNFQQLCKPWGFIHRHFPLHARGWWRGTRQSFDLWEGDFIRLINLAGLPRWRVATVQVSWKEACWYMTRKFCRFNIMACKHSSSPQRCVYEWGFPFQRGRRQ